MNTFESFLEELGSKKIGFDMVGNKLYLKAKEPIKNPSYKTARLGEQKKNKFIPSIALIDEIAKNTKRKATVNDKSAWLFLCGKNILKEGIVSKTVEEGHVIVMNEKKEVLGYGKITGAGITNLLDRGDFLRREK